MTSSLEAKESYDFTNALNIAFCLFKLVKDSNNVERVGIISVIKGNARQLKCFKTSKHNGSIDLFLTK